MSVGTVFGGVGRDAVPVTGDSKGGVMDCTKLGEELETILQLETPAIGISFVQKAPPGVDTFERIVPSACSLWREAETKTFFAPAEIHFNCPLGAMTMGFELSEQAQQELGGIVEKMYGCNYLSPDEPAHIPSIQKEKSGIFYGPLKEMELLPDLILMWLTPTQAMLYNEASGGTAWGRSFPMQVFGRPACAVLPVAMEQTKPTMSLGCVGMRTFTEVSEDRLLAVLPASKLEAFLASLQATAAANTEMQTFYREQKARLTP